MVDPAEISLEEIVKTGQKNVIKGNLHIKLMFGERLEENVLPREKNIGGLPWIKKFNGGGGVAKPKNYVVSGFCEKRISTSLFTKGAARLMLSNLSKEVSDDNLYDMFAGFGVKRCAKYLNCDRFGRSLGTAVVIFDRKSEAIRAIKQYHGTTLYGRKLIIELVSLNTKITHATTKSFQGKGFETDGQKEDICSITPGSHTTEKLDIELNAKKSSTSQDLEK